MMILPPKDKSSPSPFKEKREKSPKHEAPKKPSVTPLANYIQDMFDNGNIPSSRKKTPDLPAFEIKS